MRPELKSSKDMALASQAKTYGIFARPGNARIIGQMRAAGGIVVEFPPAVMTPNLLLIPPAAFLQKLAHYSWLLFADAYAAGAFLECLAAGGIDPFILDEKQICAAGESVADILRFSQLHADVVAPDTQPARILSALSAYLMGSLKMESFLIVRGAGAPPAIKAILKNMANMADEIEVYSLKFEKPGETAKPKALLIGGAIEEFIFTSPNDLPDLAALAGDLLPALKDVRASALDAAALQALREYSIPARLIRGIP